MRLLTGSFFCAAVLLAGCQDTAEHPNAPHQVPEVSQREPGDFPSGAESETNTENNGATESIRPDGEAEEDRPNRVTANKVIQESNEALNAAGRFAADTKKEYVSELSNQLDKLDEKIDDLDAKIDKLQGQAKQKWQDKLKTLKAKRREVDEKLDNLKSASEDAWGKFREGTTNAWNDLKQSFDATEKAFPSNDSNADDNSQDATDESSSDNSRLPTN